MTAAPADEPLITKPLPQLIFQLSMPSVLGFFLYGLNALLNGMFVGLFLAPDAFTGLTLAFPVVQGITGMGLLVGVGAANQLSLAIGLRAREVMGRLLGVVVGLSLVLGGALTVLGAVGPQPAALLLYWADAGPTATEQGRIYLNVVLLGGIANVMAAGLNLVLRGEGRMMAAMCLMGVMPLCNAIFSYISVTQTNTGIAGVAWATNLSYLVVIAVHMWLFKRHGLSKIMRPVFWPTLRGAQEVIFLGLPAILSNFTQLFQQVAVLMIIGRLGNDTDIAFFGVLNRIMSFAAIPVFGMARALQPIAGAAFGRGMTTRVWQAFIISTSAGTALMVSITIAVLSFPDFWVVLLQPGLTISPDMALQYLLFCSAIAVFQLSLFGLAVLQSIGRSGLACSFLIARQVLLFLPLAYIMARMFGLTGIYATYLAVDIFLALLSVLIVRRALVVQHALVEVC